MVFLYITAISAENNPSLLCNLLFSDGFRCCAIVKGDVNEMISHHMHSLADSLRPATQLILGRQIDAYDLHSHTIQHIGSGLEKVGLLYLCRTNCVQRRSHHNCARPVMTPYMYSTSVEPIKSDRRMRCHLLSNNRKKVFKSS